LSFREEVNFGLGLGSTGFGLNRREHGKAVVNREQ
jgi:hypothetical protein